MITGGAKGVVMSVDRTMLAENGGHIQLTKTWAQSLMIRIKLVKRKASTKKSKMIDEDFEQCKSTFLRQVGSFAKVHAIPADLVINWDQTGINVVFSSNYTMEERGASHVEIAGYGDKRMITATFAATLSGEFLPMQIFYGGKTTAVIQGTHSLLNLISTTTQTIGQMRSVPSDSSRKLSSHTSTLQGRG